MSEGDPHKRQRVSDDQEADLEQGNLKYQNACLSTRLKEQRKEILDLTGLNEKLLKKVKDLEETLINFNSNWAKVIFI